MKRYIDFLKINIEFLSGVIILAVTSIFTIFGTAFQMRDIFLRVLIIGGPFIAILPLTYVMAKKFNDHPFKLLLIVMFYVDFLTAAIINTVKVLHFIRTDDNPPKDFMVIIIASTFGMLLYLFGLAKIFEESSVEEERKE